MATAKKTSKSAKPVKKGKPQKAKAAPAKAKKTKPPSRPKASAKKAPKPKASRPAKAAGKPARKPAARPAKAKASAKKPLRAKGPKRMPFTKHQQVVYPLQGVGKILSIESRVFKDKKTPYYIIYLEASDMTVMVPVDKATGLGIRAIVSKKTAEKALAFISEDGEAVPTDWKLRYQMNFDLLKQGSVVDIAKVVRTLYHRSKIKELPILERKLFDNALKLFVDEVSFAMNAKKDDIEQLIFSRLEADLPEKLKTPVAAARDEDDDYESFDEDQEEVEEDEEDSSDY